MLTFERMALELLEYKVKDISQNREVRGGVSTVWDLYQHLSRESVVLTADERQRLEASGRILKRVAETPKKAKNVLDTFEDLVLDEVTESFLPVTDSPEIRLEGFAGKPENLDPEAAEEQAVLQRLAQRVWWQDINGLIQRLAATCRAEKERSTARLLYAVVRNLSRYSEAATFPEDINLSRFQVYEAVPQLSDPLISLNDLDNLADLVREIVQTILSLGKPGSEYASLRLPYAGALDYVHRMAQEIARDPYAGRLSGTPSKGASSQQLKLAIEELNKEVMRESQRSLQRHELQNRLKAALAHENSQREMLQRDSQIFSEAARVFFELLKDHLPISVGGNAGGAQLRGGVLFGESPALRLDAVPPNAKHLTVKLSGPLRFKLSDVDIALIGSLNSPSLFVAGQEARLEPRVSLKLGKRKLLVFKEDRYIHFKLTDEERSLAEILAEALAVLTVLTQPERDEVMTVLKTAAGVNVGEVQTLVSRALDRLEELSATAPSRYRAIEGFLLGAARATDTHLSEPLRNELIARLHVAMTVTPSDLNTVLDSIGEDVYRSVYTLTDDPVTVELGTLFLTIRKYRGRGVDGQDNIVVMMPGRPLGSFHNFMVQPVAGGTLMCVRAHKELAVLYFPNEVVAEANVT